MESFDVNTHLPPRKRLLAELKRENSDFDFLPPVPFVSGDLGARLRDVVNSPSSTPEEIIEVSKSVALAAADAAAAARNIATEKEAAAAKAKAAAKSALLFLDSITTSRRSRKGCLTKAKGRKKQIPTELLDKTGHPSGSQETDEELARKLHRAMNSSPRISNNKLKNIHNFGKEVLYDGGAVCNLKSPTLQEENTTMGNKCFKDASGEKIVVCSEADMSEREDEESNYCMEKQQKVSKFRVTAGGRKVKIKQKKLLLNQYDVRDQAELNKLPSYANCHSFMRKSKLDSSESYMSSDDAKPSNYGAVSMKITSAWKPKKINVSQSSSDSKILQALC
ncbi:uncharacterized protein LOC135583632 [Musa acuminata AAA Group]|uniref:uncharacterized protein LOC135583632 n=1 Tax=Musa acuminata AAA Group TaxID=214697 RepID=UPI0031E2FE98